MERVGKIFTLVGLTALGIWLFSRSAKAAPGTDYETPTILLSPCGSLGDVDGDGYITANDVTLIVKYVVHEINLDVEQLRRADVTGDGQVTIIDSLMIAQYLEGQRDTFPGCPL